MLDTIVVGAGLFGQIITNRLRRMGQNAPAHDGLREAASALLVQMRGQDGWGPERKRLNDALSASPASPDLMGEVRFVLGLALEYWAHRQQRYKNRHPRWVTEAKALLAKLPEPQEGRAVPDHASGPVEGPKPNALAAKPRQEKGA